MIIDTGYSANDIATKMENFRLKISKYDEILNKEVYDNIIKDFNQFEDATKPYNGKVKKTIFDNGTKHKRTTD